MLLEELLNQLKEQEQQLAQQDKQKQTTKPTKRKQGYVVEKTAQGFKVIKRTPNANIGMMDIISPDEMKDLYRAIGVSLGKAR
jgi:hypothetical protein